MRAALIVGALLFGFCLPVGGFVLALCQVSHQASDDAWWESTYDDIARLPEAPE